MKHYNVTFKPDEKTVNLHAGVSLLEAAARAGIILNSVCGGKGTCKKCTVILEPAGESVLACSYMVQSDLVVTVPETSRFYKQQILQHGIDREIEVAPEILKKYISAIPSDPKELFAAIDAVDPDHLHKLNDNIALQLETIAGTGADGLTAVCHLIDPPKNIESDQRYYNVVSLEPGDTTAELFGVAIDLGTTTVVAKLIDMKTGDLKATASAGNPQIKYGDDVISRITYASEEKGLLKLHQVIVGGINELIEELCAEAGIPSHHIYEIAAAGNTTMNHLLLKFPVVQLGQAPYEAYSTAAHDIAATQMNLDVNPFAKLHTMENIAGFVGSDTVAVAVAVGMEDMEKMTLIVDIGTNGEIVLGTKDRMYAASCAAGPALEGARIVQGSHAVRGAIESVIVADGDIDLEVIGNTVATSICGSGLIDAVAEMLNLGIIDSTGRFTETDDLPEKIAARIVQRDNAPAFVLAHNADNDSPPVLITQKDVRETQLAKAAIRAGIILLQKKIGITDADLDQILLAGAFGNYIRRESACRIGLLPNIEIEKVHFVGNAASSGAEMDLLSYQCRNISEKLASQIEYVEIANEAEFQMVFTEALMFE
jgi:uncharacterized 2Fe-2S/4Fe-4S cluster protein (DUF4445 family)